MGETTNQIEGETTNQIEGETTHVMEGETTRGRNDSRRTGKWAKRPVTPPTHFLIFVLSYMTDGPSEGQRNKGIGMLMAKVVANVWLREA